uniref:G_PROTEIN_RECEP_F1_2 domain-containing protein n=1 Tax=Steinernema glaseri TaxID=37863 RepID=A0A1I8ANG0_9BILA
MDSEFSYVYNRILDATAFGSIATKPLCIYIIVTKTPKYMRTVSYFILNELLWIFTVNFLFSLGHPLPLMPAVCFRMDGLMGDWIRAEFQQSFYFMAMIVAVVNFCFGFGTTFIYRYVTLRFTTISRFQKACGFALFAFVHLMMSLVVVFVFCFVQIPVKEYPEAYLLETTRNVFCFNPDTRIIFYTSLLFFVAIAIFIALFAGLYIRELRSKIHVMEKKTLRMQKEIQRNLLIITGWSVLVGCVPAVIYATFICHGKWPYARVIAMISMLFPLNHGTFYAIFILYLFKPYRKAMVDMAKEFQKCARKALPLCCPTTTNVVLPISATSTERRPRRTRPVGPKNA